MSHTLIYIPSYFDYIRLRNYMKKEEINFASICEYSSKSEVSRARHFFQKGDKQFLLFTERFHFYKRSVLFLSLWCSWWDSFFVFWASLEDRVSQLISSPGSYPTTKPPMNKNHWIWWAFWSHSHAMSINRFKDWCLLAFFLGVNISPISIISEGNRYNPFYRVQNLDSWENSTPLSLV